MALETNLSRSPYFDTYDANSGHQQVLFRPAVAVQTRELNELQSIQQDQINKFGRQIFVEGSVVEGCQLSFEKNVSYVKIIDEYANGTAYGNVNEFQNLTVRNSSNVAAIVINTYPGGVAQTPNLNTLYVKYNQSSDDGSQKFFADDEVLTLYTEANNQVGQLVVANSSTSGATNATGFGYIVHAQEGVIFQKGFFIRTEPQSYILTKYSTTPDGLSIGFSTIETIETPESNTQLLDNAAGAPNYSAPGAHRLKLTPVLTSRQTLDISTTDNFFSIADFAEGSPSIVRTDPTYSNLGKQFAERTFEESGNYIINPFNVRLNTKYDTNGDIVPDYLKLEIDPGLAYINGYRVETVGKLVGSVRRGVDTNFISQQTVTSTMGNYLFVKEFAGVFDPTSFQSVSLRGSTAAAISTGVSVGTSVNSLSAAGSEIGTANIIAVEYDSGAPGDNQAIYRIYITNIVMNSGQNFADVRSLYVTDGTNKGFADIVLSDGNCLLQDAGLQSLTFPFNQKAIKTLYAYSANNNTQFDFKTTSSISVSSAGIATLTVPSRAGGTNKLPYTAGSVLSNIQERDFIIVSKSSITAANNSGSVIGSSGANTLTGTSTTFSTYFANGNLIKIANSTVSEIRRITEVVDNTHLKLANNLSNSWSGANVAFTLVPGEPIGTSLLPGASITVGSPETTASINLNKTFGSSFSAQVLYNVRRTDAEPLLKKLYPDALTKIDTSTATSRNSGPWCLGVSDVLKLKHVYVGSTYSTSNPDLISSFTLDNGQHDGFYNLAYLYKKPGTSLPAGSKLLVQFDVFKTDTTGGIGYYSIDSYPVDDTGVTANTILTQDIPVYVSDTSETYDLRNTIDFRVSVTNTAVYTTDVSLANVNPSETITYDSSVLGYIPVPESSFEADLEYYVGRYDKVGLDSRGNIKVLEGAADENPVAPADIQTMMTLALIQVPPYPSLSSSEASISKRYDLSCNITYYKNRRYTMRDIATLDKRIENLEYYTTLSTLELSTKSLLIESETGGNRFQHGILVDPFNGHDIGSVNDAQYKIAIDPKPSEARPTFEQTQIDLEYAGGSGSAISTNERLITLASSQISPYISQPFASKIRNCAQDVLYIYRGSLKLTPDGDWSSDFTTNPEVTKALDLYSNWTVLDNAWGTQWGTWAETSKTTETGPVLGTVSSQTQNGNQLTTTTVTYASSTTTSNQARTGTNLNVTKSDNTLEFGSYVTDLNINQYIRSKAVSFEAVGMKPNSLVYAFFDDVNVTVYCFPRIGGPGTYALQVDANGKVSGTFNIPSKTFYSGERVFKLVDVDDLTVKADNIQTQSSATYFGTNISYAKNNVNLKTSGAQLTFTPETDKQSLTTVNSATNVDIKTETVRVDPILQTFSINEPDKRVNGVRIPAPAGVYVSSVDLYFSSKASTENFGVRVEIRNMFNGYPGPKIVPFSVKHLDPSQVSVSTDGTVKTTFTFDAPVFLENNTDYALAILPDGANPFYTIWTAEQGGIDVATKSPIFKNSSIGVMFTSSDNSTWTPYQKEDIKFALNRATFTSLSSAVQLTNDDTEYLTASAVVGSFDVEELVYFTNTSITSSGQVNTTSTTINNVSTSTLTAGDKIYIQSNTGVYSIVRNVVSVTNSIAFVVNTVPTFTDTSSVVGKLNGNGNLNGKVKIINYANGDIHISNSTSNSSVYVAPGMSIISSNSGASAVIGSVDDRAYNVIAPKFSTGVPFGTSISLALEGISNTYASDTTTYNLTFEQEIPFLDKERIVMSKSNEINYNGGNKSLFVTAQLDSVDERVTPVIDTIKASLLGIHNIVNYDSNTAVVVNYDTSNGVFVVGDIATDLTTSANGPVVYSYSSNATNGTIIVDSPTGTFTAGANVKNSSNTSSNVVANMVSVSTSTTILASEKTPRNGLAKARYISKKVVLADGQDAEDLKVYIAAYKPSGTDVYVFAKLWNATDSDPFDDKAWTQLETTDTLVSSKVNQNDFIEYTYNLPNTASTDQTSYLNSDNSNIVRYVNSKGQIFDTYKAFSIKIVLLSNDSSVVPRLQDYRAIAVSV